MNRHNFFWFAAPLATVLVAVAADRIRIEYRLSAAETINQGIIQRLDRIENKLDRFIFGTPQGENKK